MPSTSNRQASIDSRRIALEREITIRVPRFDTFVTEYSSNISTTGMFIVSDSPQAPGTTFAFEFSVADDWKLIRGKAQVVWTRYRDEGGERPAGMGVRFVELDAQSRRLIRWIVEKHIREGGKPFELDELRNVIDEALEEVIDTDDALTVPAGLASAPAPTTRSRARAKRPAPGKSRSSERKLFPLIAIASGIVLVVIFLFWLTEWLPSLKADKPETVASSDVSVPDASGEPSGGPDASGPESEPTGSSPDPTEDATPPVNAIADQGNGAPGPAVTPDPIANPTPINGSAPPIGSAYAGVREALTGWSSAWSDQNADGYLSAYSKDFKPVGSTRSAWEALRRERLAAPAFIKVAISQLDIQRVQDNLVKASFSQSYRSDRFSDTVTKEIEMVWEDGAWKIWREIAR